ncbi:MAG: type I pullulanase [Bacilli bacterium]|nr:type I pullulanase [Bacilli bacterium]
MSFIKANLVSKRKIDVFVFTSMEKPNNLFFKLYKDDEVEIKTKIIKQVSTGDTYIYSLELPEDFSFGHAYSLAMTDFPMISVDVSDAVNFQGFDEEFYYDGDDLGTIYSKKETKFAVWAPLASDVTLKLEDENSNFSLIKMKRGEKGVYRVTVDGDLLNRKYHYLVTNSGVTREANDPYGKGVSLNSIYSAVVDFESLIHKDRYSPVTKINNYVDAVIYETNVRDFTEDKYTNIKEKGKFLGFVEEGKTTKGGHPAGIDYLKYLGITHVQLNPICDFDNVKDDDVSKSYNWGYDPLSYFSIDGSFSSNPEDPSSRLNEFSTTIEKLHEKDIRVVLDVVYNHVFNYITSCFEKIVPNYYFRRTKKGQIANASGCGNDFASERLMVRKLIVDSTKYLIKYYNVDGFRFDLMGLLDIDTINEVVKECKSIKSDLIFYGEGWNMGLELPQDKKACSDNHDLVPGVAFFNDTYRDIIKGPTSKDRIYQKGYINGDVNYAYGMDHIIYGCIKDISYKPRFSDANQSINYAECHDNHTLFDKLLESNSDESKETLLRRISLANDVILSSIGIPFFHMGQEIGLSKEGLDNTYNVTKINNMNWELIDERWEMVEHFKNSIAIRKMLNYTKLHKLEEVDKLFKIEHWDNGIYCLEITNETFSQPFNELVILINPLNKNISFEFDNDYTLIHSINGKTKIHVKRGIISGVSLAIYYR